jgi:hypothetical protein
MPASFIPPPPASLYTVTGRQSPLEQVLQHYLEQQSADSASRIQARLARMRKAENRVLTQRLNDDRDKIEATVRAEREKAVRDIEGKINGLSFRQAALASQVRAYTGQSRADAQLQSDMLGKQITSLELQQTQLIADIRPEASRRLEAERKTLQAQLEGRIAARAAELEAAGKRVASELKSRIERQAASFAERVASVTPAEHREARVQPPANLLPPDTGAVAAATVQAVRGAQNMQTAARRDWQAQRAFAVNTISVDVYQAAQSVAAADGWKLVPPSFHGAKDITTQIAAALRKRWRK